jgi:hypothetical protein
MPPIRDSIPLPLPMALTILGRLTLDLASASIRQEARLQQIVDWLEEEIRLSFRPETAFLAQEELRTLPDVLQLAAEVEAGRESPAIERPSPRGRSPTPA